MELCIENNCNKEKVRFDRCMYHYDIEYRKRKKDGTWIDLRKPKIIDCSNSNCKRKSTDKSYMGLCQICKSYLRMNGTLERKRKYGGKNFRSDGYIQLFLPGHPAARKDGYIFEHRFVAWENGLLNENNLKLHVHHIDGNKTNNTISNLEIIDVVSHAKKHALENGYIKNQYGKFPLREKQTRLRSEECLFCGDKICVKRIDAIYCSSSCRVKMCKSKKIKV